MDIKAYITLLRAFALPFVIAFVVYGAALAPNFESNRYDIGLATGAMACFLFAAHYFNGWYDYVTGIDKKTNGSTAASYTSACEVLPSGRANANMVLLITLVFLVVGNGIMLHLSSLHGREVAIVGVVASVFGVAYSCFFKPRGLGEMAVFVNFGYCLFFAGHLVAGGSITVDSMLMAFLPAVIVTPIITVDAAKDVKTDLDMKIRTFAAYLSDAEFPLSRHVEMSYIAVLVWQMYLIATNLIPAKSFISVLATPFIYIGLIIIDKDHIRGAGFIIPGLLVYSCLLAVGVVMG